MPASTDVELPAELAVATDYAYPVHQLKTTDPYFDAVRVGAKTFDLRRDDRNFQPGDLVLLRHWITTAGYTGPWAIRLISYVMREHPQVETGYVILGLNPVPPAVAGRMLIEGSLVPTSGNSPTPTSRREG